jgi:hypothetical protein
MRRSLTRLAVAGSAAALCTGLALPALADTATGTRQMSTSKSETGPLAGITDVAQARAAVDSMITSRLTKLAKELASVNTNSTMNATVKAADLARIAARMTALQTLRTQIDTETTVAAMRADLNAFWLAQLKSWVDFKVETRVTRLTTRLTAVNAQTGAPTAGRVALAAQIQLRINALQALRTSVDASTTLSQARAELTAARALFTARDELLGSGSNHLSRTVGSRVSGSVARTEVARVTVRPGGGSAHAATWHLEHPQHHAGVRAGR